jgi:GTP cyclohydrolase IA
MNDYAANDSATLLGHEPEASRGATATSRIGAHMASILTEIGEDLTREGLRDTPRRFEAAFRHLTSGYAVRVEEIVGNALFEAENAGMVLVRDIDMFSLCEHHLLPFYGRVHVAYLPRRRIIGLSKIPRLVDCLARRLQVQERLTTQIGEALLGILEPRGVAVAIDATHLCMAMRGVRKPHSETTTSFMHGDFASSPALRQEFFTCVNRGR